MLTLTNQQNLSAWRDAAEIDYFAQFIKAWIAFNAWYRYAYGSTDNESRIIDKIKSDGNVVRSRIVRLLVETDEDADQFRTHLSRLHNRLESYRMMNRATLITFTNCYIGVNQQKQFKQSYGGETFCAERETNRAPGNQVLSEIIGRHGAQAFCKVQPHYSLQDLQSDADFVILSVTRQTHLLESYKSINPKIEINLLDIQNGYLEIGSYHFCNNPDHIFAGLVEVLYTLRCMLFHGEVTPTRDVSYIYEPAYHILRRFLQCIV